MRWAWVNKKFPNNADFQIIDHSLSILLDWCQQQNYKGWDLFDGLNSKFFQKLPLYHSRFFRLVWIQFFKRSPLNLRRLCLVPKDYNPKGLSLFASALIRLGHEKEAEKLLLQLIPMACNGYEGRSWGYNFDWESRAFYVPRGKPNIVTTTFVANAFLDFFQKTKENRWLEYAQDACKFILRHLLLQDPGPCLGYIPGEQARVHNANMLGACLLGRVYSFTGDDRLYQISRDCMGYAMRAIRPDFTWPYGERYHHQFVDNFHTGFNLVALNEWMKYTEDFRWKEQLNGAYRYFLDTFWLEDGCPKYYNNSLYPIDIHCSAQGIVTCCRLAQYDTKSMDLAVRIAQWAIENMQDKTGYFYYQKTRWYTNKIPYIRWSQAWMVYGLAVLSDTLKNLVEGS